MLPLIHSSSRKGGRSIAALLIAAFVCCSAPASNGQTGIVIEHFETNSNPLVEKIAELSSILPSHSGLQTTLSLSTNLVQGGSAIEGIVTVQNIRTQSVQKALFNLGYATVAFKNVNTSIRVVGSSAPITLTNLPPVTLEPGQSVSTNLVIRNYGSMLPSGVYTCSFLFVYHGGKYIDLATPPQVFQLTPPP